MKNRTAKAVALYVAPAFCLPFFATNVTSIANAAPAVSAAKAPAAKTPAKVAPVVAPKATPKAAAPSAPVPSAPAASSTGNAVVAPPAIAVTVNNDKLPRADLERWVNAIKAGDKSLQTGSEQATKSLAIVRQNQIDNWVYNRLLNQEIVRRRIVPSTADVDAQLNNFRAQLKTPAAYQTFLKNANKSEANLRQFYVELLAQDELSKRLSADVTISAAQIQQFYDTPPADFQIPLQARAHQILLIVPQDSSAADKAKIKARADEILTKAKAPNADFVALVVQYSEDPGAKENKGDSGPFAREEVAPPMKPFADAVFSAKKDQILGPIETVFGYHILRVDEAPRKAALDADFKSTIRAILVQENVRKKLDEIVENARQTAVIKINP